MCTVPYKQTGNNTEENDWSSSREAYSRFLTVLPQQTTLAMVINLPTRTTIVFSFASEKKIYDYTYYSEFTRLLATILS